MSQRLREYAGRRGWKITAEYVDVGVRGSRESRPELNRMLAAAHSRAFDAVVCWKLDRLGRSLKHLEIKGHDTYPQTLALAPRFASRPSVFVGLLARDRGGTDRGGTDGTLPLPQ